MSVSKLSTALVFGVMMPAVSQVIVHEPFTAMPVGVEPFGPSRGSSGWNGGWYGNGQTAGRLTVVQPPSELVYSVPNGGVIRGGDRVLRVTTAPEPTDPGTEIRRQFSAATNFFVSFLVQVPSIGTGSDLISVNLLNAAALPLGFKIFPSNSTPAFAFAGLNGASRLPGNASTTHLIVLKYKSKTLSLYVDPDTFSSPRQTSGSVDYPTEIIGLTISVKSSDASGLPSTVLIDEIRCAATFESAISATTPPAILPPTPVLFDLKHESNTETSINWTTEPDWLYQLQCSDSFSYWQNLGIPLIGDGHLKTYSDQTLGNRRRFYRLLIW